MTKLKKVKSFGIGKFLVMALVLGGGLIYGTQMVQKNQENRSSAASKIMVCKCSRSEYKTAYLCAKNKAKWTCSETLKPNTPTPTTIKKVCSYSSCGDCRTPTECNNVGCGWDTSVKACGTKAKTTTTYYYHNQARKSCIGVDLYNSIEKCKAGTNATCYTNKPACDAANSCRYLGVAMSNGESICFNSVLGNISDMVQCSGGKTTITARYVNKNCVIDPVNSCRVWDVLILDNETKCVVQPDGFSSKLMSCTGGNASTLAIYPKSKDCSN